MKGFSRQELVLIFITLLWGSSYYFIQTALSACGAMFFVGTRFLLAGLLAACVFYRSFFQLSIRDIFAGVATGGMAFLGQSLQTEGLETISVSQSAFLTALYVPLVPIFQWAVFRKKVGIFPFLGILLAFAGLLILSMPSGFHITLGKGDILTLLSAVAIAFEIVFISFFVKNAGVAAFSTLQLITCGALGFGAMKFVGEAWPAMSWAWIWPSLLLGVASLGIQLGMTWAQKTVSASRAAVIYAGEPVWGAVFGRVAGDRLPFSAFVGGALIVAAVIVSEQPDSSTKPAEKENEILEKH